MKVLTTFFLIFLFSVGLSTSLSSASAKDSDTKVIHEKSFSISAGKKLVLNSDAGDIQITPWNKSEVKIKVIGNDNAADKFTYDFNATTNEVKIDVKKKGGWSWFSNIKLKFEINVPSNFNIYSATAGGDIKIGGITGDITLKTSGGDVWGDRFEGNFVAKTSGGDIKLYSNNAKIDVSTSGGDIDLEYAGINKGVKLNTSGGDIDIKVPQNFNADVDLGTSGGDVECNLTLNNVKKLNDSKIIGSINQGGAPLVAHTSGGDITVSKK